MKSTKIIHAIDTHTMGEPTHIIVGGVPHIPGKTMAEKREFLKEKMDSLRTSLMYEPRGHNDMFGAIITEPTTEDAHFGTAFMDCGGYLNMCGHGAIGVMTIAVETGMVEAEEPVTEVILDTPAGIVKGEVHVSNGNVTEVSIENVPSFLLKKDLEVEVPGMGKISLDIAFGGNFFAIVSADRLRTRIEVKNRADLVEKALELRDFLNTTVEVRHPELSHIDTIDLVEIYDTPANPKAHCKNVVVFGQGQVDRSPCGTGTSAKLATLYARGEIGLNEEFIHEGILGTTFRGKIKSTTTCGGFEAVIPVITGSAFITAFSRYVIDPDDPLKNGFLL